MRVGSNLYTRFGVPGGTDYPATPEHYLAAARARAEAGFDHVELSADAHTYNADISFHGTWRVWPSSRQRSAFPSRSTSTAPPVSTSTAQTKPPGALR